ncbi:hypothetical protein BH11ACT8_BH11ACT8_13010 [soil metagenome]
MSDQTDKPADTAEADAAGAKPEKFGRRSMPAVKVDQKKVRILVARIIWAVCVLFAVVLAADVLLIAIEANEQNDLVIFVRDLADKVDLGFFDLKDPIKDFDLKVPYFSDTKTALFNYGLAAIAWLIIGRVADKVIRP